MKKIGVLGTGTMGAGIIQVLAQSGYDVVLRARRQTSVDGGIANVTKNLEKMVDKEKITEDEKNKFISSEGIEKLVNLFRQEAVKLHEPYDRSGSGRQPDRYWRKVERSARMDNPADVYLYEETVIPLVPILILVGIGPLLLILVIALLVRRHRKKWKHYCVPDLKATLTLCKAKRKLRLICLCIRNKPRSRKSPSCRMCQWFATRFAPSAKRTTLLTTSTVSIAVKN